VAEQRSDLECGGGAVFFVYYLMTHGLVLLAMGPVAVIVTSILSGRSHALDCDTAGGSGGSGKGSGTTTPSKVRDSLPRPGSGSLLSSSSFSWPLETFGIHVLARMRLELLFKGLGDYMDWILNRISSSMAVRVVCLPTGGFYLLRALLARVNQQVRQGLLETNFCLWPPIRCLSAALWMTVPEFLRGSHSHVGDFSYFWVHVTADSLPSFDRSTLESTLMSHRRSGS
jgi:hypothetical protein